MNFKVALVGRILSGAAILALPGCLDLSRTIDLVVPAAVVGLPPTFRALPVRAWIADKDITADALAGCFEASCDPPMAVGVFRASRDGASELRVMLERPERLRRELDMRRAAKPGKAGVASVSTVEPYAEAGLRGVVVSLSQRDGSHPIVGIVIAPADAASLRFVMAIGADRRVIAVAEATALANLF